jgi:membrane protein YqaA with SNARE-associated domain
LPGGVSLWVRVATLLLVLGIMALGLILWVTGQLSTDSIGYPGVWLISWVAASSIIFPIPGLAAPCLAVSPTVGLFPLYVGLVAASAEAIGEMTGYLAGIAGSPLIEKSRFYPWFRGWVDKRGGKAILFFAILPIPVFDLLGIAAGALGYSAHKFFILVLIGKSVKSTSIAYSCYFGFTSILNLTDSI